MHDIDPIETQEWLEALEAVIAHDGTDRARFLIEALRGRAQARGAAVPVAFNTPYVNTVAPEDESRHPGDEALEERILDLVRWNAMAMVTRANDRLPGIGGHIATYQSASTLWEVGLNHFWRAGGSTGGGDMVHFQGHASPGLYARAFLEGRLDEAQLDAFRQETSKPGGLSSYPHPRLMPDFWQFAVVSMGLGPLTAIYQARFLRYLHNRGLQDTDGRTVWAFLGDGEMDEPESQGALTVAAREGLDNLVFVINCNLQRLDGPVRGNGKIVQEMEALFRGAGWNVIKCLWGREWDPLFAQDHSGVLRKALADVPDGEFQVYAARDGAFMREKFFGRDPALAAMVADWSDEQIAGLRRGGHDPQKVHAAYSAALAHRGQPTLILAQTVKGWGLGEAGEGLNIAHNVKKMGKEQVRAYRDRLGLAIPDDQVDEVPFLRPGDAQPEMQYLHQRRAALGGGLPQRATEAPTLDVPDLDAFGVLLKGTGKREQSTTMSFVRALTVMTRAKGIQKNLVPILADEARTFGMEGMFRQLGIYAPKGQLYEPVDADQLMFYKEAQDGQILQEGINEAGALASWTAAGTSHANHGLPMIPLYIFYSMFGFQRVGDFIWAAADMRARGFLIGGTSGRTTLNGEGLQHEDGHSHLIAATVPSCMAYDPTYGYELAVILQDGLRRMYGEGEDIFYYITTMNENYPHPEMPEGVEEGIRKGLYRLRASDAEHPLRVQLLGSGTILREIEAAAAMLEADHGIAADVWSAPSFVELARDGQQTARWNRLHPEAEPRASWIGSCLDGTEGPVIAATDYMHAYADQVRAFVPRRYVTLGTDGFGRSDTREALREFFEVDRRWIVCAALKALADDGALGQDIVARAIAGYGIDPEKPHPTTV